MAHSTFEETCGWQAQLRDPSLTRALSERFGDEFLMIKRYRNRRLLAYLLPREIFGSFLTISGKQVSAPIVYR